MTPKEKARQKIHVASSACERAEDAWRAAVKRLNGSISLNGYGVHHDRYELAGKLFDARHHIQVALDALNEIEWPTNEDYDNAES